jgi:phage repressor protein C with HTH and peptisase S24 domain
VRDHTIDTSRGGKRGEFVKRRVRWSFLVALPTALCLGRLVRMEVAGESMMPTLEPGDRLLVLRTGRNWPLRLGGLVALADPRTSGGGDEAVRLLVKRVTRVDGALLEVQGDNAAWSTDSRTFGSLRRADVVGIVLYRYGPPGRSGKVG